MKYVRFQSLQPCSGTPSKLGIFQIAFRVRNLKDVRAYDADAITRQMAWLQKHLHSPDMSDSTYRAIFWFKDTAHEPLRRVWAMKPFLEAYGYWIEVVKTWDPGNILYEDGWQVAAKPWRSIK
ncbi:MAG: hypothetical protein NXH78_15640 [Hyphomonadaceae bacterium]|nr:hypothetical protein [Hyphomonadaceae bacterium]